MRDYKLTTTQVRNGHVFHLTMQEKSVANAELYRSEFDEWLEQENLETQRVTLAWERERFDRLWQLEMDVCKCEEAMQHLKIRMERTQSGIDYKAEFGDSDGSK